MENAISNECILCGAEIPPEEELCDRCKEEKDAAPCPMCGKIICECEVGGEGE